MYVAAGTPLQERAHEGTFHGVPSSASSMLSGRSTAVRRRAGGDEEDGGDERALGETLAGALGCQSGISGPARRILARP